MNLIEIIKKLFGRRPAEISDGISERKQNADAYEDISEINFTAIIANKLATLTISDSNVSTVTPDQTSSVRSEFVGEALQKFWRKNAKRITSTVFGEGGVLLLPRVQAGKVVIDVVPQKSMVITDRIGDDPTGISVITAETCIRNEKYYRIADYFLENGDQVIRYRAVRGSYGSPEILAQIFPGTPEEIRIPNVATPLFVYLKCPADARRSHQLYGVPITYGCDDQITKIKGILKQIFEEYDLKRAFVGIDQTMLDKDGKLPASRLFKQFRVGGRINSDDFWKIFDPAIRNEALYAHLTEQLGLLERMVGVSRGVLTKAETETATAAEIHSADYDTLTVTDAMRDAWEDAVDHLVSAIDVLLNYYHLTPVSDYRASWSWSYSLLEDTDQTFKQLNEGISMGYVRKVEGRQFLFPDETLEESQEIVNKIQEEDPPLTSLINVNG